MTMTLTRLLHRPDGIFGKLTGSDGYAFAVTLEHAFTEDDRTYDAAIPAGTYRCTRYASPKLGYVVWLLHDVPGHTYCLIHIGNWNVNSDGCILVGETFSESENGRMVTNSKATFHALMERTAGEAELQLIIQEAV